MRTNRPTDYNNPSLRMRARGLINQSLCVHVYNYVVHNSDTIFNEPLSWAKCYELSAKYIMAIIIVLYIAVQNSGRQNLMVKNNYDVETLGT